MKLTPTKPVLRVLERCFAAEIQGMLAQFAPGPHCTINGIPVGSAVSRASSYGLIEQVDRRMAFDDGMPPMLIRGFALTHHGRMAYCQWAATQEQEQN